MAGKPIVWTSRAEKELYASIGYWNKRTLSTQFGKKLAKLVKRNEELISMFPEIGRSTQKTNVRIRVVSFYLLVYEIGENQISVLTFFDGRQNPNKLSGLIGRL